MSKQIKKYCGPVKVNFQAALKQQLMTDGIATKTQ